MTVERPSDREVDAARVSDWVAAARPRTLAVALSAVAVGVGVARAAGHLDWWHALFALVVAVSIQIGTNYANDYSDGVRGADTRRVGPVRLVASGRASPAAVRGAALASLLVGAAFGLVLAFVTSPWLILVGAASLAAGWFYTGGRRPYGYAGFGEVFVFVFFGLVAVIGTAYVSSGRIPAFAWIAASADGFLSVAMLVVNNLRDRRLDEASGKRTLSVMIGDGASRLLYASLLVGTFALVLVTTAFRSYAPIGLAAALLARRPTQVVLGGAEHAELIPALAMTGLLELVFGVTYALGVAL